MTKINEHMPVLLGEVVEYLNVKSAGIYVDGTFGRGGHALAILRSLGSMGRLYGLDQDPQAVAYGLDTVKDPRMTLQQASFAKLEEIAESYGIKGKIDGILLDLGVSSPQLDDPERGFSFLRNGPLDMRMDPGKGMSAAEWLAVASEQEIADVLKKYGEERFSKRIACAIIAARDHQAIITTGQLAEIIAAANPAWEKHKHPATRSFQAIRIFINRELEVLQAVLEQCLDVVAVGGRIAIISFHSLEDRIVKRFMQKHAKGDDHPRDLPIRQDEIKPRLKIIGRGIRAQDSEIASNPRARSAILRVAEKLQ